MMVTNFWLCVTYFLLTSLIPSCFPGTFGIDTFMVSEKKDVAVILHVIYLFYH